MNAEALVLLLFKIKKKRLTQKNINMNHKASSIKIKESPQSMS